MLRLRCWGSVLHELSKRRYERLVTFHLTPGPNQAATEVNTILHRVAQATLESSPPQFAITPDLTSESSVPARHLHMYKCSIRDCHFGPTAKQPLFPNLVTRANQPPLPAPT